MPKHASKYTPYIDVALFATTLLLANALWKWVIQGDEGTDQVCFFGRDVTAFFNAVAAQVAGEVYWLLDLVRPTVHLTGDNLIRFDSGSATRIVWSCTPIKQAWIWLCLLLTTRGGWVHKSWFIPMGWACIWCFNILRIFLISLAIEFHPEWFELLHTYLFKYLFYGMLFALWVWFVEGVRK